MRARLLIALVTTATATAAASEARDFPPPATIKPSLVPWIERAEDHDKHDYQQAIADANRALQTDPRNVAACSDAYLARAGAFLYLKRYNQAAADLLEAVKVDPKSTDAFNSLAWLLATCPDSTVRNG